MTPAQQIKEARRMAGLTQAQAAEQIGLPIRTFQNYEADHRRPTPYVLQAILRDLRGARELQP